MCLTKCVYLQKGINIFNHYEFHLPFIISLPVIIDLSSVKSLIYSIVISTYYNNY